MEGTLEKAWLYKDGLNPIAELDGAGNVTARFVYAARANVPDYVIKGGVTYRIISDHLGSPRLVVDTATGAVAQQIEYDEWGKVLVDTVPGFQPFAFAGGLYDADTKLIRFGARDYDPQTGRWTSKDPIGFSGDGPNLYGYAINDPTNRLDLNGLLTGIITTTKASGLGTHSALYVDNSGNPLIYDPAGSYDVQDKFGGSIRGTGDVIGGKFVKFEDFLNFHLEGGDKVIVTVIQTDEAAEKKLASAIENQGTAIGGTCAISVGSVLRSIFPDLEGSIFPGNLLDSVNELPGASTVEFNEVIE